MSCRSDRPLTDVLHILGILMLLLSNDTYKLQGRPFFVYDFPSVMCRVLVWFGLVFTSPLRSVTWSISLSSRVTWRLRATGPSFFH